MNRCRVSFTDTNGIPHDVEVQAESLYEAVALAVAEFRADKLTAEVGPMTEFVIAIHRPAVEHRLRLNQVTQWAQGTRDGPAGVISKCLTNTPVPQAGSVLKCPDDRKNRVVSAQATYPCGGSAVGGGVCEKRYAAE